jgi:hypothetical protein
VAYSLFDDVRQWLVRRSKRGAVDRGEAELDRILAAEQGPAPSVAE